MTIQHCVQTPLSLSPFYLSVLLSLSPLFLALSLSLSSNSLSNCLPPSLMMFLIFNYTNYLFLACIELVLAAHVWPFLEHLFSMESIYVYVKKKLKFTTVKTVDLLARGGGVWALADCGGY